MKSRKLRKPAAVFASLALVLALGACTPADDDGDNVTTTVADLLTTTTAAG
jgi:hypothetical protein